MVPTLLNEKGYFTYSRGYTGVKGLSVLFEHQIWEFGDTNLVLGRYPPVLIWILCVFLLSHCHKFALVITRSNIHLAWLWKWWNFPYVPIVFRYSFGTWHEKQAKTAFRGFVIWSEYLPDTYIIHMHTYKPVCLLVFKNSALMIKHTAKKAIEL